MKKCLPVIMVMLILSFSRLEAQIGWVAQTNPLGSGEEAMIGKIQFLSLSEGWISANGGRFLHTTNGGNNWIVVDPFPSDTVWNFSDPALDMIWTDNNHGWRLNNLGAEFFNSHGALLYKTTDGGINWSKKYISTKDSVVAAQIEFVDQNYGWITLYDLSIGTRYILKSTDGGDNWNIINTHSPEGCWLDFVDQNNGWLITTSPNPPYKIQKTTDGGANWVDQYSFNGTSQDSSGFDCIQFTDLDNGWIVGDKGKILHTTNGGIQWNEVNNSGVNISEDCKTLFFLDANTGWIPSKAFDSDQTPFLVQTMDGGSNWSTLLTPFGDPQGSNAIFSIYFFNKENGWLTGDLGRIARYTGPTSVEDDEIITDRFVLMQNYPNPFNPTTKIKFVIPNREAGHGTALQAKLVVFDILGNLVSTLVSEAKQPGTYEVEFDASNLPSGVYIYTLHTGNFVQSKNMLLLK